MAPRTREQQDAYNQKRRAESAAKKAPQGKPATKAKKVAKAAKKVKARREDVIDAKIAKQRLAEPKHIFAEYLPPASELYPKTNGMLAIQQTPAMNTTLARSYVRKTGAGVGKLRRGTYQCTVAFTKAQMDALVAKASFRCVSLAEMIRSCVVENLGIVTT